ncbi:MAG: Lrp/AsnC ligand binding domain-containing protein [Chloroflexi bacterium]|nr:Lrp/AsnC ligand binding domain-containing protein [Chloroflexota bacterium]
MARAYVLIETAIGKTPSVVHALRQIPGVKAADAITGPYDVIAIIEAEDASAVGQITMRHLHNTEGVNRTMTCFVVD